jgi:Fur family transcriptional regulator, ferric uptake regulator
MGATTSGTSVVVDSPREVTGVIDLTIEGRPALADVIELLRKRGGRVTAPRRAIVEAILRADDHHVTAQQLTDAVQKRNPEIAPSTIYRTLDVLVELGIVEHTHVGHGPAVFHLSDHGHAHVICHVCGGVTRVAPELFTGLASALTERHNFELLPTHVALSGRCGRCR